MCVARLCDYEQSSPFPRIPCCSQCVCVFELLYVPGDPHFPYLWGQSQFCCTNKKKDKVYRSKGIWVMAGFLEQQQLKVQLEQFWTIMESCCSVTAYLTWVLKWMRNTVEIWSGVKYLIASTATDNTTETYSPTKEHAFYVMRSFYVMLNLFLARISSWLNMSLNGAKWVLFSKVNDTFRHILKQVCDWNGHMYTYTQQLHTLLYFLYAYRCVHALPRPLSMDI